MFENARRKVNNATYTAKKNSPLILMVGGAILGIAAGVLAAKKSKKASDELKELEVRDDICNKYDEEVEKVIAEMPENYSQDDLQKEFDKRFIPAQPEIGVPKHNEKGEVIDVVSEPCVRPTAKEYGMVFIRNYAIPVALGAASLGCFVGSYLIMNNRLNAATAALASVTAEYLTYREKVKEEYGVEVDEKFATPVEEVEKAHGRKPATYKKAKPKSQLTTGFWMSECPWFTTDDIDYNSVMIEDINARIDHYLSLHPVITIQTILGGGFCKRYDAKKADCYMGYSLGNWTGLSTGSLTRVSDDKGDVHFDMFVTLPKPEFLVGEDIIDPQDIQGAPTL